MGLEELKELVVSGEGLTTSDLQQIKERATLIWEAQLEVRGTKRPAENDDPDSEYSKKSNIKYTQIETLQLRASLRQWTDWKADLQRAYLGAPNRYRTGQAKIIMANQYMAKDCRSQWDTYSKETPKEEGDFKAFLI